MMKKISLLFTLLLSSLTSTGQTYYPMLDSVSNTWYYTGNVIPVRPQASPLPNCDYWQSFGFETNTLFTTGDTLINGFIYQSITQASITWPGFDCVYGYIREDTAAKKIYFMDNIFSPEELIYDFSMVPGNIINLNFFQSGGVFQSGNYTLDSIGVVQIHAGPRRLFYLSNHNFPGTQTLQWIESTGHPGHLVYTKSGNFWGGLFGFMCTDQIDRNFYQMLTCFEHDATKVYFDSCSHSIAENNSCFFYADSCTYWNICGGSVYENNSFNNVHIAPNPFATETNLIIDANRNEKITITVYGVDGRFIKSQKFNKIIPGKNIIPLQLSNLRSGMYFIEISSTHQSYFLKTVKTGNNF